MVWGKSKLSHMHDGRKNLFSPFDYRKEISDTEKQRYGMRDGNVVEVFGNLQKRVYIVWWYDINTAQHLQDVQTLFFQQINAI
jgi:hypothetical protein